MNHLLIRTGPDSANRRTLITMSVDAFAEVGSLLRRFTGLTRRPSPYCVLLVGFFEDEVEQRGAFYGWPYHEVEKAIGSACSIGWTLAEGFGKVAPQSLAKQIAGDLGALAKLILGLCQRRGGPFPACTHCKDQCEYRFEMARVEREAPSLGTDFRAFFSEPEIDLAALSRFAWETTSDTCFTENDTATRRGAAFCFAAQQLAGLGLSTFQQRDVAARLYGEIEEREREYYGQLRVQAHP